MKPHILHYISRLLCSLLLALGVSSCLESEPFPPSNELANKEHEDPSKAIFILTEGKLREGVNFDNNPTLEGFLPSGRVQRITIEDSPHKGWTISEGSTREFVVTPQEENSDLVYLLEIEYYNPNGDLMNDQFMTYGEDKLHQHFFVYYGQEGRLTSSEDKLPYRYRYTDTDARGKYIGQSNPIGFSGLLRFSSRLGSHIDLSVELLHASESKYTDGAVSTAPYYLPTLKQRGESWDIKAKLHIHLGTDTDHHEQEGDGEDSSHKLHEEEEHTHSEQDVEATKAILRFAQGHLHGIPNFHQNAESPARFLKGVQSFTFEKQADGAWVLSADSPRKLYAKAATFYNDEPSTVYGLWIDYFDASGKRINGSFINQGADKEHQHFFLARDVKPAYRGQAEQGDERTEQLFDYTYADTTPWYETHRSGKAQYNPPSNPLGFKGYFAFKRAYKTLELNILLAHTPEGKTNAEGKASPYYKPSPTQRTQVDIHLKLPVHIYMYNREALEDVPWERISSLPESQYSERDRVVVHTIMNAYGISWAEVVADLEQFYLGDSNPESGGLWF